jgi:hypothetical protein
MSQLTLSESSEKLLFQWRRSKGTNPIPDVSFIDPLKLRRWVGDISVVHVHEGQKRFYVALHGANVARHLGPDFNRRYLEDAIPAEALTQAIEPYELSMKINEPVYSIQRQTLRNGLFKCLERMILPVSVDEPGKAKRFLVWVAPITPNSARSTSIFIPFDSDEMGWANGNGPDASADLYVLSQRAAIGKIA